MRMQDDSSFTETVSELGTGMTIRERLDIEGKPLHVVIISLGSFFLLSFLVIIGIDIFVDSLMFWFSHVIAGLDVITSTLFTVAIRVLGAILLIMTLWIGFLGKPLYEKRPAEIVFIVLKLAIILLLLMAANIGIAIITAFAFFLWNPPQLADWDDQMMSLYRLTVVGIVGIILLLEIFLTESVIGADILPSIMTASLAGFLNASGLSWLILSASFIVFPLYIFLPRILMVIWSMRRGIENFWIEFVHHKLGLFGFFLIAFIILLALFAPWLAPEGSMYHWTYTTHDMSQWFLPPSWEHPLGTNHNGADILGRVIWGTQISLLVGLTASVVAVTIGTSVGLLSGYYGGLLDSILMRITDVFLCLPTLPLMLIFLMFFGTGLQNVIIVIAILGWTGTARMVRSEALSLRERPLTEAAHAIGASDSYILFRHILPNTLPLILANVIIGVVGAILGEAGISFLGFMPIHGQPSWGIVLYWASRKAALSNELWWWIGPPGIMIMLTAMGFAFVSHAADKVVNPRLRGRR